MIVKVLYNNLDRFLMVKFYLGQPDSRYKTVSMIFLDVPMDEKTATNLRGSSGKFGSLWGFNKYVKPIRFSGNYWYRTEINSCFWDRNYKLLGMFNIPERSAMEYIGEPVESIAERQLYWETWKEQDFLASMCQYW